MTNKEIARALKSTAAYIELTGGNPYRSRAFENAARTIERLEPSVAGLLAEGRLTEIRGIGDGLAAQIGELLERGSFALRDDLIDALPPGLLDLLKIKGLGTKKVRQLWKERGITSLDALEAAAAAGDLSSLDGFGAKTEATILENIERHRRYSVRRRYATALGLLRPVLDALRAAEGVRRAEPAGDLRRCLETVGAADVLVAAEPGAHIAAALAPWVVRALPGEDGEPAFQGSLPDGLPLRVRVVAPARFGTAWWYATGSDAHVAAFVAAHGAPAWHADEADIYRTAGLEVVPPELREASGELQAAAEGSLPSLITVEDLRGTLHNHSTYSDGAHTLRQMADAARSMGLSYFGICDHSRTLTIANGLSIERVREQQAEIRALNEAYATDGGPPFRIFSGTESDILADGSLDYPEDVLASFDLVVASVHSGFNMTEAEATERILRAIASPYTNILGHATGRLLLSREGYPLDHLAVVEACAEHDVAIELNANPYRLDMDWRWLREATSRGVLIAINPDAHSVDGLHDVRWGVAAARKGWLTAPQCLNARALDAFTEWLERRTAAAR